MTDSTEAPETTAAPPQTWVDTLAPAPIRPFLKLSRVQAPIGTWLLLIPCWWGLALAALHKGSFMLHDLWIGVGCGIGALLMRGAGCTWNDITDRDIDGKVERTRTRPIPSGQVGVRMALGWMLVQTFVSLLILLTFNTNAILLGLASALPVLVYPFAKRFTWWPQVFLGIAFNWGALLAWTASTGSLGWPAVALYLGGIAWTLFYDTIYAHQDTDDDALIGVKSTARLFGTMTPTWLRRFLMGTVLFVGIAALMATAGRSVLSLVVATCGAWAMGWHLMWQIARFDADDNARLWSLFCSNRDAGLIVLLFFAAASVL